MYAAAGVAAGVLDGSDCMDGRANVLSSPDIGLQLGQSHSPGLSEDALGGDQEFMDAMQAMAGQTCCLAESLGVQCRVCLLPHVAIYSNLKTHACLGHLLIYRCVMSNFASNKP